MDTDSQLHLHRLGKQIFSLQHYAKFECSYSLDLEKKWSLSTLLSFWKKTSSLKVFIMYKENSCRKKILIINFLSAIYVVAFFLCIDSNFRHLRNNVSGNNGVKYLPYTFLLRLSFDVKKYKFIWDWNFRSFAPRPLLWRVPWCSVCNLTMFQNFKI